MRIKYVCIRRHFILFVHKKGLKAKCVKVTTVQKVLINLGPAPICSGLPVLQLNTKYIKKKTEIQDKNKETYIGGEQMIPMINIQQLLDSIEQVKGKGTTRIKLGKEVQLVCYVWLIYA